MNSLQVIKTACADALEEADEGIKWQAAYASVVDPSSVLELCGHLQSLLAVVDKADPDLAYSVREAIHLPKQEQE